MDVAELLVDIRLRRDGRRRKSKSCHGNNGSRER